MLWLKKLSLFALAILFAVNSLAANLGGTPEAEKLTDLSYRPRVAQILEVLGEQIAQLPVPGPSARVRIPDGKLDLLPQMLVDIERAYPGARFAFLGRDAHYLGDILDAFYLSIGQKGRVIRLNASTPSFSGATQEILAGFLRTNGVDFDNVEGTSPFVIIDYTSYGPSSQSTKLINAGYAEYQKKGVSFDKIVRKFNLISFGSGDAIRQKNADALEAFFKNMQVSSRAFAPTTILFTNAGGNSGLTYGTAWHDTFTRMTVNPDGSVTTQPGPLEGLDHRIAVLNEIVEAIKLVQDPAFLPRVLQVAKNYNFEYPVDATKFAEQLKKQEELRIAREKAAEELRLQQEVAAREAERARQDQLRLQQEQVRAQAAARMEMILSQLLKLDDSKEYVKRNGLKLTDNAHALVDWHRQYSQLVSADVLLLQAATEARMSEKIGDRDYRRLFGYVLNISASPQALITMLDGYLFKEPSLLKLFERTDLREQYMNSNEVGARASVNYAEIFKALHARHRFKSIAPRCIDAANPTDGQN